MKERSFYFSLASLCSLIFTPNPIRALNYPKKLLTDANAAYLQMVDSQDQPQESIGDTKPKLVRHTDSALPI